MSLKELVSAVIEGNFEDGEINLDNLLEYDHLFAITTNRRIYYVRSIDLISEEICGVGFMSDTEIHCLCVKKGHQNKGFGKTLLSIMLKYSKRTRIYARASNERAIHLYESMGFCRIKTIRDFYSYTSKNEDGVMMERN